MTSSFAFRSAASNYVVEWVALWVCFLRLEILVMESSGKTGIFGRMRSLKGSEINREEEYYLLDVLDGSRMPIPPSLAGRARRSRTKSHGRVKQESVCSNSVRIMVSRDCKWWLMRGLVRARYDHRDVIHAYRQRKLREVEWRRF